MLISHNKKLIALFSTVMAVGVMVADPSYAQSFMDRLKSMTSSKSTTTDQSVTPSLTQGDIAQGLKDALRVGSENVVANLGKQDGFNNDKEIHIPLPPKLEKAKSVLKSIGMSAMADDLELRLNRAAETATPIAKPLFLQAIKDMTLDDVTAIYKGPDDAATKYFQEKMTPQLKTEMSPVVDKSLADVGAIQSYDQFVGKYKSMPFVPDIKTDLSDFVVDKTLDGIFHYIAVEEAAIRKNPIKRTTDILKKVFTAVK